VGIVHPEVYRGGMVGIVHPEVYLGGYAGYTPPCIYTTLYMLGIHHPVYTPCTPWVWEEYTLYMPPPPGYGRGTLPWYIHPILPWVHPVHTVLYPAVPALRIAELRCERRKPWAQKGELPWVRGSREPSGQ